MSQVIESNPVPAGLIHPAVRQLLKAQAAAKWRKLGRAFSCRRRIVLSVIAILLTLVWIGNVVMSVMLREAAAPERFSSLVTIGLFVYALWHVVKSSFSRPEQEIEWTSAEAEFVCGAPLHRHQLIAYKLTGILNATFLKASCFAILMLPDLRHPVAGFVGFFLGLIFLDLIRLAVEITTFSLATPTYRKLRLATGVLVVGSLVSALIIAFSHPTGWHTGSSQITLAIAKHLLASGAQILETPFGAVVLAPFERFAAITVAEQLDASWWLQTTALATVIAFLAAAVVRLDSYFAKRRAWREKSQYPPTERVQSATRVNNQQSGFGRVAWLGGAGPIAWRQWIGARKHRSSLIVAMALPGILALLPVWVCRDGAQAAVQVSAAVVFYSFLLLPTALKFDFRRDITRMIVLKSLPVSPLAIVFGQILTPSCLAFLFQTIVLTTTMIIKPFAVSTLVSTLLVLFPLNLLIFAIDNLVYLLYPYQLNQEGIEIFLRTTLTFTAKGVIFTLGLVVAFFWAFAANRIASSLAGFADPALIFVIGSWIMLCIATFATTLLLSKAYERFDPSQDTP